MTTKEQERKALEQIKKIVAGLGENSYVGTAFAGCFEDAEQNIEYDAAYSSLGRAEAAEKKELEVREALAKAEAENQKLARKLENIERSYELEADAHQKELHDRCEWAKACNEATGKLELAEVKIEEQALEIMKLKAKLFDLMFGDKMAG